MICDFRGTVQVRRVVKDIDSPFHLDEKEEVLYNIYNSYNERR